MTEPFVSVIMPVYNVEKYIENSVRSVLGQTYGNFELIVVDDGSLDSSIKIAEKILSEQKKIKYSVVSQKNSGLGTARNTGLFNSNGEWVIFLDSDDMLAPDALKFLVKGIATEDTSLVFSGYKTVFPESEFDLNLYFSEYKEFSREEILKYFLLRQKIVLAPGTLYRKEFLLKNNLYFSDIRWSEDQHFIWRVLDKSKSVSFVDLPIYLYLLRSGSIMSGSKTKEMITAYSEFAKIPEIFANDALIKKYLLPRWVIGTLNSASRVSYQDWKKLYFSIDARLNLKKLISFPDKKVSVASIIALVFPKLYYKIAQKRNK